MKHRSVLFARVCSIPLLITGLAACQTVFAVPHQGSAIETPNGAVVGDVSEHSAVLWSRADREAVMKVIVKGKSSGASEFTTKVDSSNDYAG